MENGSFEKHINRLRNYYQTKRDAILQVFQKEPLGKYVTIREEGAGVHFLMQIRTEKSEEEIVTEAKGKGIKLAPLSHYFDGGQECGGIGEKWIKIKTNSRLMCCEY